MTATHNTAIGIDLGGTNVRVGLVDANGALLTSQDAPIEAARGPQHGVRKICDMISAVLHSQPDARLKAIGIGATGPIDRKQGAIQNPYTLPTWEDVDIVSPLARQFGVPVTLENDADAAAMGEAWSGAGCGFDRMAHVTIGTGIGVGFILHGKIYRGAGGIHPESGHMLIDPSGPLDYCGGYGCWEVMASGTALERHARQAVAKNGGLLLKWCDADLERIDGGMLVSAARRGDSVALDVVALVGRYIGMGLVNLIMTYLPDCIVMGGGVMAEYDLFEEHFMRFVDRHNIMVPAKCTRITPSLLGGKAGVIGAAYAGFSLLKEIPLQ